MPDLPQLVQALGWAPWALVPLYFLGIVTAVDAVMKARTPQGATAWVFALVALPLLALPLYWILGRFKFDDYVDALREFNERVFAGVSEAMDGSLAPFLADPEHAATHDDLDARREVGEMRAFARMATVPFTHGNRVDLLIDGEATFGAILSAIDRAETYVLAQFYIIHDDEIGTRFKEALLRAAARGCEVRLLYDAIGSWKLPRSYRRELRAGGVHVSMFAGPRSWLKKLRLNFRNHRKIVVCDGREAFVGGLNVGDEYLGHDPDFPNWRDTHLEVAGPIVQGLQLSFARDWYYAAREELDHLEWEPQAAPGAGTDGSVLEEGVSRAGSAKTGVRQPLPVPSHAPHPSPSSANVEVSPSEHRQPAGGQTALVLASGPADELETCGLLFAHAIESAERRVWIATPYFVPDGRVLGALQLAALRGVDVRVLMPRQSDSLWFRWVPYAYLPDVERAGVRVLLYEPGFMHQKVTLVDDDFAAIGTANFDNRSFRRNFEATVVVHDEAFCAETARMLERDMSQATAISREDLEGKSFAFRFAAQATRLLAPVL